MIDLFQLILVDGEWDVWSEWSNCSVTCGDGVIFRNRSCIGPIYEGKECVGNDTEIHHCNDGRCSSTYCIFSVSNVYF